MQVQATEPPGNDICVARGYGLKVAVHRGHLIVHDGVGRDRRTRRYHRASSRLRRLVVIGHTGYVTLGALRWLYDTGAAVVHLDVDGRVIATSGCAAPGLPGLRRAQVLAAENERGVEVARGLLVAKLEGQKSLLEKLPGGEAAEPLVDRALGWVRDARDLDSLVSAEADAAGAYWAAWAELPVPYDGRLLDRVPEHWRTFGRRRSLLTNGPRTATNPPNAILNYLYALLEAETVLACHALGLDPLIGISHKDREYRASLALDIMEAVRPAVDAYVLALLTQRTLAVGDFVETRQGACRLGPAAAARLAATLPSWRERIAPFVEHTARALTRGAPRRGAARAPLSRANYFAAWNTRTPDRGRRPPDAPPVALPHSCRDCGIVLTDRRKRYCDECRAARWQRDAKRGQVIAVRALKQLRAENRDPRAGREASAKKAAKMAAHQKAVQAWSRERPDLEIFRATILPHLENRKTSELVATTGLSQSYCYQIRLGHRIPHARHWDALRRLGS